METVVQLASRLSRPTVVILCTMAIVLLCRTARSQDAIFQGDEARTGCIAKLSLSQRPVVLWKFEPSTLGVVEDFGGPLAAGDAVYCSDRSGRLFALWAADGAVKWTYQVGKQGRSEAPLVMGDIVYYATCMGVIALSAADGSLVWKFDIEQGADETSPLIVDDLLFACGYDGIVYALNPQTGEMVWSRDVVADAPPSPAGFDGRQARSGDKAARPKIAASDGKTLFQPIFDQSRVVALDCQTGEPRWSFQARGWIFGNPVVTDKFVLIGSQDDCFHCLDKQTGKALWKFKTGSRIEAGGAVDGDSVFFGSCDQNVYRLDLVTGKQLWKFHCETRQGNHAPIYCAPLVSNGIIYLANMEGQLYALSAADGALKWKLRPSDSENSNITSNLATSGNRLFLTTHPHHERGGEQAIYCLGEAK